MMRSTATLMRRWARQQGPMRASRCWACLTLPHAPTRRLQALREHEELTKVKNIDRIELGCHSMPTWYYSPFPPEFRDAKVWVWAVSVLVVGRSVQWAGGGHECVYAGAQPIPT